MRISIIVKLRMKLSPRLFAASTVIMSEQAHYNVRQSASHAKSIGITQRATPLRFPWVGDLRVRYALPDMLPKEWTSC